MDIIKTKDLVFEEFIRYPDISIKKGRVVFLVGSSGSGKSTLLKLFNATLSPSSGDIFYEGQNIYEIDTLKLRREVLLVGQSVYLFDGSIKDNFYKFYSYREIEMPSEEVIKEYLSICQLDFPLETQTSILSGGEAQRLYTAIFLSFLPKIIMLDEPTSALDTHNAKSLLRDIIKLAKTKEMTVIVVSHDKNLSDEFAEDIIDIEGSKTI
ncbi:ATP-binding cassette domain-containing protein [Soehngenia longivitae]|uniref:ATP-binding cassette domain-containing protein n=1 Tax=Soehngenia longivitae TaxID=2562294 RepID=A0A4Z0D1F9_9FIRM|nr:ABC transporter ATP-binding protein [Soehngenia longivitae]TFZ39148.1 ATP-binding cassette domain-containing protein [Soehngenia longivitae]